MKKQDIRISYLKGKLGYQRNLFKNGNYSNKNRIIENIKSKVKYLKDFQKRLYFESCNELFYHFSRGDEIFLETSSYDEFNLYKSFKLENNKLITTYFKRDGSKYSTDKDTIPYYIFDEYKDFYIKETK